MFGAGGWRSADSPLVAWEARDGNVVSLAAENHAVDEVFEVSLPAREESISEARHAVGAFLSSYGWSATDIQLAVTEAVANAVEHGYRRPHDGVIVLRLETLVPQTLVVTVSDDGAGIGPDPESSGLGYGLALIGRLSRAFEISRREPGTAIRMTFGLTPATSAPPQSPWRAEEGD
jgi:serine/threonine-protein kinase RsbW